MRSLHSAGAQHEELAGYRNKTYVAFASEDISKYRLMEAWYANEHIDFDFFDAHDLFIYSTRPEIEKGLHRCNPLYFLAPRPGLEPGTCGLTVRRSTN